MLDNKTTPAPVAAIVPHQMTLHGDQRTDNYYWLKNRDSAEVLKYLNEENAYAESISKHWQSLTDTIFQEMKSRVKEDDSSPPSKNGPFYYYVRYETGKEYPIYCRKQTLDSKEEIILDVNQLAKDKKYTSVASVKPSTNHEWIAYPVDFVGRRIYEVHFKNLKTGKTHQNTIPKMTGNFVWGNDNDTIIYARQNPETLRSEKIFRFSLSTGKSEEIYFEKDEIFSAYVSKSQDDKFIFINSQSVNSTEVQFLNADHPKDQFKVFLQRQPKLEYTVDHGGDQFFILTNLNAVNFQLMTTTESTSSRTDQWKTLISHRTDTLVENFLVLRNHLILEERFNGLTQLEVFDRQTMKSSKVQFPDPAYVVGLASNLEYDTQTFRYSYQSLVRPNSTFDYNLKDSTSTLIKESEVPGYKSDLYTSERVWAPAHDGAKIPVSLVYRKDQYKPGKNPALIYGYGSYGISMDPSFRLSVVSLMDRGFVYAVPHIRGGSEMGREWFESGRMMNKTNTFKDFISATEYLIADKKIARENVFAMGGSAGGLLMGAITNMRPDLYKGIVSVVPFVDVLTTMLDPDIPLTTGEYEQWGNPNEKEAYEYIKSYSPYDNMIATEYPALLMMTGYHDSQVQYWEPAKYIAKLRTLNKSEAPVLFKIDMEAGHSGPSGRFQALKDLAYQYAFIVEMSKR